MRPFGIMFSTIPRTGCDLVLRFLLFGGCDFTSRFLCYVFYYSADGCSFGTANPMPPRTHARAMSIPCNVFYYSADVCAFATANPMPPRTQLCGVDLYVRGGHLYVTFSTIPRTGVHLVQQILCPRGRTCARGPFYVTISNISCTNRYLFS